jgi:small-conductance mechanosensitive channel
METTFRMSYLQRLAVPTLHRLIAACLLLLLIAVPGWAAAQTAPAANSLADSLKPLVEQAEKSGATVVVIAPKGPAEAASAPMSMTDRSLQVRDEIKRQIQYAGDIPWRMEAALGIASPDGTNTWLYRAIATAIGGLLVGYLLTTKSRRWGRRKIREMASEASVEDAGKIGFLLRRAALIAINTLLLYVIALLAALAFDSGHSPSRQTILVIITAYIIWRALRRVVMFNMFAPDAPGFRLFALTDEQASRVYRDWTLVLAVVIAIGAVAEWMARIDLDADALKLTLIFSNFIAALLIGWLTLRHRAEFALVIRGNGKAEDLPLWRRALAASWHELVIVYLVVAFLVSTYRLLLHLPSAMVLIGAPVAALFGGLAVYGLLCVIIDRAYRARRVLYERRARAARQDLRTQLPAAAPKAEPMPQAAATAAATAPETALATAAAPADPIPATPSADPVFVPLLKPLLETAAGVLVSIFALAFVLNAWDVRVGEHGNPITAFLDSLVVVFIGWFLYRAVTVYVDKKLQMEGIPLDQSNTVVDPEESDEKSTSRLGTLLPLVRSIAVGLIVAMATMILLSRLGVDIAPLFAGAGVVGLAIGFGAQTLIRDMFSGGFFLFDDAFRKGEYVELGDIRGTVEKISLRSFQLRHHNGALHTVPFGDIKNLTNYSRDWVIMKLPLRVTYDTDVEKVRKLVKKLGEELLQHPDVGKSFMQPLKSQGVIQMEDSAMIIRVKYMTRPGDQWATRKVVYAAIRELFQREGIRFASREVTVRLAEEPRQPLTPTQQQAIGSAVRRVVDGDGEVEPHMAHADDR